MKTVIKAFISGIGAVSIVCFALLPLPILLYFEVPYHYTFLVGVLWIIFWIVGAVTYFEKSK